MEDVAGAAVVRVLRGAGWIALHVGSAAVDVLDACGRWRRRERRSPGGR
ncbi:hypothetical protein ACIQHY_25085 [Streptomyces sp. NPDC092359]